MSELIPARDAGYQAAQTAILQSGGIWKLRPLQEDYVLYVADWEEYLAGWMQAIHEDREKQLSWDFFYPDGNLRDDSCP